MEKIIFLSDVLKIMRQTEKEKPVPFSIEWRSFNSQNKLGGRLNKAEKAILCFYIPTLKKSSQKNQGEKNKKNPNHFENRTRNIELLTGNKVKIHIDLITKFNNKKVVL